MSNVYFNSQLINVDLKDQSSTNKYIQEVLIRNFINSDPDLFDEIIFRKVTKNDKINEAVNKLSSFIDQKKVYCLYSYGPHIQKMISIIEIFKRSQDINLTQWNKLANFELVEQGRNELLSKKTKVPILIAFLKFDKDFTSLTFENDKNCFSKQVT